MLRRGLSAALVMFVIGGFVLAGTYTGIITKHEDGKITIKVGKKDEAVEKTFKVSKDVKITKVAKKGEEGEEVKAEDFTKMVEKGAKGKRKGIFGKVETKGEGDKEEVTKITVFGGRKK